MSRPCDKVQSGQTECRNFLADCTESTVSRRMGIKFSSVVILRQPEQLSVKLLLSNPAVPFDPGSREITLSLMYQDDIINIGHVFEVRPLKASKEVRSVAGSASVCFSKTVMRDTFIKQRHPSERGAASANDRGCMPCLLL